MTASLCGTFVNRQAWIVAEGIFVLLVVGMLTPWILVHLAQVEVSFARRRIRVGETFGVHVVATHRPWWRLRGLVVKIADWDGDPTPFIFDGRASDQRLEIRARARGLVDSSQVRVISDWPFGITAAWRQGFVRKPLIIWPAPTTVPGELAASLSESLASQCQRRRAGRHGEFSGIRAYRDGDRLRSVHWAQTARRDQLMVSEAQTNAVPVVSLFLDTDAAAHVGVGIDSTFEWAVRIAAAVVDCILVQGGEVYFLTTSNHVHELVTLHKREQIMDELAVARMTDRASTAGMPCPARGETWVVITTDRTDRDLSVFEGINVHLIRLQTAGFSAVPQSAKTIAPMRMPEFTMTAPGVWEKRANAPRRLHGVS
ncbi:MAG: DUF58 domain-containing protein [Planctomycetota bacterium]